MFKKPWLYSGVIFGCECIPILTIYFFFAKKVARVGIKIRLIYFPTLYQTVSCCVELQIGLECLTLAMTEYYDS
jgi:hypothetical protein